MQSHFSNDASTIDGPVSQMRFKSLSPDASSNELRSGPNAPFTIQSNQPRHPLSKVNSQPRNPHFGLTGGNAQISNENSLILASILNKKEQELTKVKNLRMHALDDLAHEQSRLRRARSKDHLPPLRKPEDLQQIGRLKLQLQDLQTDASK